MTLEERLKVYQEMIKKNPLTSVTVLFLVSLVLLFAVPYLDISHRGINNATVEATLENQSRATLAQILGGVAIGIGLYYTWRRIGIAEEDLKVTQENLKVAQDNLKVTQGNLAATQKIAQENLKVAQEGQITERFTRAVDQLGAIDLQGNPSIEIRLGGIYALERISKESKEDYWPIMEILTAYVRKNSWNILNQYSGMLEAKEKSNLGTPNEVTLDIQATLSVIGRRYAFYDPGKFNMDLKRTYLPNADMSALNFALCDFKCANLERAIFRNSYLFQTSFIEAQLGKAIIFGANLKRADFTGAHLIGADLTGADLRAANLEKADLYIADLKGANLKGAKNLTVDQLSKAKTLYKAELDEELEAELRAKGYGHLFDDEPKD